jgi:hypothetical protein
VCFYGKTSANELIKETVQLCDHAQTQVSSVSSTLKSPIFPDLACGLGSAAEQIKDKLIIKIGQNGM